MEEDEQEEEESELAEEDEEEPGKPLVEALFEAVASHDVAEVSDLLEQGKEQGGESGVARLVQDARNEKGDSLLHCCARHSAKPSTGAAGKEVAELLIRHQADPDALNRNGDTPLLLCCHSAGRDTDSVNSSASGSLGIAQLLLYARAEPDTVAGLRTARTTALVEAVRKGHSTLCLMLLRSRAEPRAPGGKTVWQLAHQAGKADLARLLEAESAQLSESAQLFEQDRELDFSKAAQTMLPLRDAARAGDSEAVARLLDPLGRDAAAALLSARDPVGGTLLHSCAAAASTPGATDVVRVLLEYRARFDVPDDQGRLPLELAAGGACDEALGTVQLLLAAKAAPLAAASDRVQEDKTALVESPRQAWVQQQPSMSVSVPTTHKAIGSGPLAGVRVLEACSVVAGPLCAGLLADMGADVIKIERGDGEGDKARVMGTHKLTESTGEPLSALFSTINRGKRSLTLDLKRPAGTEVLKDLLLWADVLVQSFRPGVAKRLGLDYKAACKANPAIIAVDISGWGPTGPYKDLPGFDALVQARSGLAALNQDADGHPAFVRGSLLIDKLTPQVAARAICAALFQRERKGGRSAQGQHVEVSMLDVALEFAWPDGMASSTFLEEKGVRPGANPADAFSVLPVADDGSVAVLSALLPDIAQHFAPDILQDRSVSTYTQLRQRLGELFRARGHPTAQELRGHLAKQGAAEATLDVLPAGEVHQDDQVKHRRCLRVRNDRHLGSVREARPAARFQGVDVAPDSAPLLGEHTEQVICNDLGYSKEKLAQLQASGVLGPVAVLDRRTGTTSRSRYTQVQM
eukprot:TRINITY_DN61920_c0_g1_i1.p1 TRINITY_DN61920_c0_g1~~TRINITY_DN61920_c0_g1_i1.p1  ORF type:complete len:831 (+),score=178.08 TRINITY_DN61920_c0_g1_i1:74-2494(+)